MHKDLVSEWCETSRIADVGPVKRFRLCGIHWERVIAMRTEGVASAHDKRGVNKIGIELAQNVITYRILWVKETGHVGGPC